MCVHKKKDMQLLIGSGREAFLFEIGMIENNRDKKNVSQIDKKKKICSKMCQEINYGSRFFSE